MFNSASNKRSQQSFLKEIGTIQRVKSTYKPMEKIKTWQHTGTPNGSWKRKKNYLGGRKEKDEKEVSKQRVLKSELTEAAKLFPRELERKTKNVERSATKQESGWLQVYI